MTNITDQGWLQLLKAKRDDLKSLMYKAYRKAYDNMSTNWTYIILYADGRLDMLDDTKLDNLVAENKKNGNDYIILCIIHSWNQDELGRKLKRTTVNKIINNLVNAYTNLIQ